METLLRMPRGQAEARIQERIETGRELISLPIQSWDALYEAEARRKKWHDYNLELLRRMSTTSELADDYYSAPLFAMGGRAAFPDEVEFFRNWQRERITSLESILERLELIPEVSGLRDAVGESKDQDPAPVSKKVFIVHGHDNEAKQEVARFIESLGLEPIILHERANQGRTIIEKFEDHAEEVGYAVILLTPDDVGASKESSSQLSPRARQNVILELGFFYGSLGRDRVCAIHKGGLELPSDISGIVWVQMDPEEGWKLKLAKEIAAAGLEIDSSKLVESG